MTPPNVEAILQRAWSTVAPQHNPTPFPRGVSQDLARVAVYLALDIPLDFRPCICTYGSGPEPTQRKSKSKTRAENTATLLALLEGAN